MEPLRRELESARDMGVAVQLHLVSGERLLTGLHDWNAEEGWFSVYDPQHLGDYDTTRTIMLDQVASWTLTDVSYRIGRE